MQEISQGLMAIAVFSGILGTMINISNDYSIQLAAYAMWCASNSILCYWGYKIGRKSIMLMYLTYLAISIMSIINRLLVILNV